MLIHIPNKLAIIKAKLSTHYTQKKRFKRASEINKEVMLKLKQKSKNSKRQFTEM